MTTDENHVSTTTESIHRFGTDYNGDGQLDIAPPLGLLYTERSHRFPSNSTPAITSNNALRLHIADLDKDDADDLLSSSTSTAHDDVDTSDTDVPSPSPRPHPSVPISPSPRSTRVRFRSRVRITSGLPRHKPKPSSPRTPEHPTQPSLESSRSSSPSSSISAPLRSRADDETSKPGWGPLGLRVAFLAFRDTDGGRRRRERRRRRAERHALEQANERTPLRYAFGDVDGAGECECDVFSEDWESQEEMRLSREIDQVFGKWPRRLLNHHWWWWQFEPILCCHCGDEFDTEG